MKYDVELRRRRIFWESAQLRNCRCSLNSHHKAPSSALFIGSFAD
jgi:hypothetical protein